MRHLYKPEAFFLSTGFPFKAGSFTGERILSPGHTAHCALALFLFSGPEIAYLV